MELEEWGHTVRSDTYRHTNTHMETYTPHTHVQEREKKIVKMREDAWCIFTLPALQWGTGSIDLYIKLRGNLKEMERDNCPGNGHK